MNTEYLEASRKAQSIWEAVGLRSRVTVVARLRLLLAGGARELAETVPVRLPGALSRTVADTLVSEVLPLIEACRFLEREAEGILATRRLGKNGRPVWLGGVETEIQRQPWGVVLVLGAANYPLLLAGVQVLQALVAGNAVLWKPAPGTAAPALKLREMLLESGLDAALLTVLDDSIEAATEAIAAGVDHVVLTGSVETGKTVMRQLAETMTPATMELSGCDAVFVLPGADWTQTVRALAFGLRFNGSFTCMAARRVFLVGLTEMQVAEFEAMLIVAVSGLAAVEVTAKTAILLSDLVSDARERGASILLDGQSEDGLAVGVTLIGNATSAMKAMRAEIFAPILSLMRVADVDKALVADQACAYGLTASIFGPEDQARTLAARLRVGNVLINDLIVPTADPRIAFGGRGRSGFGVTRGKEGLLAMTTPRTIQMQRKPSARNYQPTGEEHVEFFSALALALYARDWKTRWDGLRRVMRSARSLQ